MTHGAESHVETVPTAEPDIFAYGGTSVGVEEVREEAFIEREAGGAICRPLPAFVDDPVPNGHVELAVRLGPKTFSRIIELEDKTMF